MCAQTKPRGRRTAESQTWCVRSFIPSAAMKNPFRFFQSRNGKGRLSTRSFQEIARGRGKENSSSRRSSKKPSSLREEKKKAAEALALYQRDAGPYYAAAGTYRPGPQSAHGDYAGHQVTSSTFKSLGTKMIIPDNDHMIHIDRTQSEAYASAGETLRTVRLPGIHKRSTKPTPGEI